MSNNSGALPFFGATYEKRTIAILRNSDYDATISSIKNVFPALAKIPASCIIISAVFWPEYGSGLIEIGREPWSKVWSKLTIIEISVAEEFIGEEEEEEEE